MTIRTEPSVDPVGTVRRDEQGRLYVRTDEAPPAFWVVISGPPLQPMWRTPGSLADTVIVGVVPGTPAADLAQYAAIPDAAVEATARALAAEVDLDLDQIDRDEAMATARAALEAGLPIATAYLRAGWDAANRELAEIRAALIAADPKADLPGHAYVPSVDIVRALAAARDAWLASWDRDRAELDRLRAEAASNPAVPDDAAARLADKLRGLGLVDPDDDTMPAFKNVHVDGYRIGAIDHWVGVEGIAEELIKYLRSWPPTPTTRPTHTCQDGWIDDANWEPENAEEQRAGRRPGRGLLECPTCCADQVPAAADGGGR